ncbi:MAG: hypothetical protein BRD26_03135 [Bacteroidetes bacterium QH_1_64_81]|nr:MAG: hypothetical protein BRD26_03135 [Bacteroidetes bacterium QH_1_64_81]
MRVLSHVLISFFCVLGLLMGGCRGGGDPTKVEKNYGAAVDATEAVPAPAVAAEDSLYLGHRVTIDGRITAIRAGGCEVQLAIDAAPLVVAASRSEAGDCAWQVPNDAQGFAVAAGTLRTAGDTLRLTANGVRVTPVRVSNSDS